MVSFLFKMITLVIVAIVFILFSLQMTSQTKTMYESKVSNPEDIFRPQRAYSFDISDVIVDPDSEKGDSFMWHGSEDSEYCKALKKCIVYSVKHRGEPCVVFDSKFSPGNTIESRWSPGFCNDEVIYEDIPGGRRQVCEFENIFTGTTASEWEKFGALMPDAHMLNIQNGFRSGESDIKEFVFPRDYFSAAISNFNVLSNRGGRLRIVLTDGHVDSGKCKYTLYQDVQYAFAYDDNSTTLSIFKLFRDFDVTKNISVYGFTTPSGASQCYNLDNDPSGGSGACAHVWYYMPYKAKLDRQYTLSDIVYAIDTGLYEWDKLHYDNRNILEYLGGSASADRITIRYDGFAGTIKSIENFVRNGYKTDDPILDFPRIGYNFPDGETCYSRKLTINVKLASYKDSSNSIVKLKDPITGVDIKYFKVTPYIHLYCSPAPDIEGLISSSTGGKAVFEITNNALGGTQDSFNVSIHIQTKDCQEYDYSYRVNGIESAAAATPIATYDINYDDLNYVKIIVDLNDEIGETNEANNIKEYIFPGHVDC